MVNSFNDPAELTCLSCGKKFLWTLPEGWPSRPPSECPECKLRRQRTDEAEGQREFIARQEQYKREQVDFYRERSHLRKRYFGLRLPDFNEGPHNKKALELGHRWVQAGGKDNFIISGPISSGKTHLAACLFGELTGMVIPCLWLSSSTLLQQVRQGYHDEQVQKDVLNLLTSASRVPVLFLDDLGKNHPGSLSWIEEQLHAILDPRSGDRLPTVITTEWQANGLEERVGRSVVSRLLDGAWLAGIGEPYLPYRGPNEAA